MLKVRKWPLPAYLARHVRRIAEVSGASGPPIDYILPDCSGADIAIHLGNVGTVIQGETASVQPSRLVVGSLSRAVEIRHGSSIRTVYVSLPLGCACMLGMPAAALRDVIAPLDAIAPALDRELRLWAEAYRDGRANAQGLFALLANHVRPCCDRVVRQIGCELSSPASSVTALASSFGLSRRQIDRRFRTTVGRTPRELRRIVRFANAWKIASSQRVVSWADLAASAGYFDQAHLIHDFRLLTHKTPRIIFSDVWYKAFDPSSESLDSHEDAAAGSRRTVVPPGLSF